VYYIVVTSRFTADTPVTIKETPPTPHP